jgi:tripartite-type tricarboxylate transporter receptor subunit TctC
VIVVPDIAKTLAELIALAKKAHAATYATAGVGTSNHLSPVAYLSAASS